MRFLLLMVISLVFLTGCTRAESHIKTYEYYITDGTPDVKVAHTELNDYSLKHGYVKNIEEEPCLCMFPILLYHAVLPHELYYPIHTTNPVIMEESIFLKQMTYLYVNGFTTLTSEQLITFLHEGVCVPPLSFVLTFDDGYLCNAVIVAPILRKFNFTAIQFLIGSEIPTTRQKLRPYPVMFMSLYDIIETKDVFEFVSHTFNLHYFIDETPALIASSIDDVITDLNKSLSGPLTTPYVFSFPFGAFNEEVIDILDKLGFLIAMAGNPGYVTRETMPFTLPRFDIVGGMEMYVFQSIVHAHDKKIHS